MLVLFGCFICSDSIATQLLDLFVVILCHFLFRVKNVYQEQYDNYTLRLVEFKIKYRFLFYQKPLPLFSEEQRITQVMTCVTEILFLLKLYKYNSIVSVLTAANLELKAKLFIFPFYQFSNSF